MYGYDTQSSCTNKRCRSSRIALQQHTALSPLHKQTNIRNIDTMAPGTKRIAADGEIIDLTDESPTTKNTAKRIKTSGEKNTAKKIKTSSITTFTGDPVTPVMDPLANVNSFEAKGYVIYLCCREGKNFLEGLAKMKAAPVQNKSIHKKCLQYDGTRHITL